MQIIFPLVLGFLLLGIVAVWFLQAKPSRKIDSFEAQDALYSLRSRILPASVVERIFDWDDLAFARNEGNKLVVNLIEAERKAIALYWLGETLRQVRLLMSFYLKCARQNPELTVGLEFRLAFNYFVFWGACKALVALIWFRGSFGTGRFVRRAMVFGGRFCSISENIFPLADMSYTKMQEMREMPADRWPTA